MCEATGASSMSRLIHMTVVLVRMLSTLYLVFFGGGVTSRMGKEGNTDHGVQVVLTSSVVLRKVSLFWYNG